MTKLHERMEKEINSLKADFEKVSIIGSTPDIGTLRENFIQRTLKSMLPSTVGICNGVIFDAEDNRSNQQDIIIYRKDMPKLSFGEGFPQFLFAEGAIATIEVKSKLDKAEFERAMNNIHSVKSLKINRKPIMSIGYNPKDIKCYVFGYDSVELNTLSKYIDKYAIETVNHYWFDQIIILDRFSIYKNDGTVFPKKYDKNFVVNTVSKQTILALFYHLMENMSFSFYQIDWSKYINR